MTSHRRGQFFSVYDAKLLLNIESFSSRKDSGGMAMIHPTKEDIQKAFLQSARKYHPDGRHHPNAQPCPIQFRQCVQARDLLLHHYHGPSPSRPVYYHSNNNYNNYDQYRHVYQHNNNNNNNNNSRRRFAQGFPFRTLRLSLTLKQKLAIRGSIFALVSAGALYDKWVRMENQKRREADKTIAFS